MIEFVVCLCGDQLMLGYGSYIVVKNFNVLILDGYFIVIIGFNGCGKLMLLCMLSCLMMFVDGYVWLDGEQIQCYVSKEVVWCIGLLV